MPYVYRALYVLALVVMLSAGCLLSTAIGIIILFRSFDASPLPMGDIGNVIVSSDAVFFPADYGRVYQVGLDGRVIDWVRVFGSRHYLSQRRDQIVVHSGHDEWTIDKATFRVRDSGGVRASVERNLWGHPFIVVDRPEGRRRISIQAWYLTVFQTPVPAIVWTVMVIVAGWVARWVKTRWYPERNKGGGDRCMGDGQPRQASMGRVNAKKPQERVKGRREAVVLMAIIAIGVCSARIVTAHAAREWRRSVESAKGT